MKSRLRKVWEDVEIALEKEKRALAKENIAYRALEKHNSFIQNVGELTKVNQDEFLRLARHVRDSVLIQEYYLKLNLKRLGVEDEELKRISYTGNKKLPNVVATSVVDVEDIVRGVRRVLELVKEVEGMITHLTSNLHRLPDKRKKLLETILHEINTDVDSIGTKLDEKNRLVQTLLRKEKINLNLGKL
jgi:hypothetical protein